MGQKCNPISNRLGIVRGWDSNWFGGNDFGDNLLEDSKIRKYLNARLSKASVSKIVIERTLKLVTITICTARPGFIIGKGGEQVEALKKASSSSDLLCTAKMPRPPPPPSALSMMGSPISSASWRASSTVTAPSEPGTTGMPSLRATLRHSTLLPSRFMASSEAPMKTMPLSRQRAGKRLSSEAKPQPGWMPTTPLRLASFTMRSISR